MYGIREGYQHRAEPNYFHDVRPDNKRWQCDVIPIAVHLARVLKLKTLIDIGCGRGYGLVPYASEFNLIGIDYGANIEYCRQQYEFGRWLDVDLSSETPYLDSETLKTSMVVCSDVVEHLVNPECLILSLRMAACCAPLVVFSTPDRERVYGYDHSGVPGNPHHVREWTLSELVNWLPTYGLHVQWAGWTLNNNVDREKSTCLLLLSRPENKVGIGGQIEGLFDLEKYIS